MGTIVQIRQQTGQKERAAARPVRPCEIVIFPGVRIERHDIDLAHRMRDSAGRDDFGDGVGGGRRPRKTS
jgi:hypothetical protein